MNNIRLMVLFTTLMATLLFASQQEALAETSTYLDNGTVKAGVDLSWGGALFYLSGSASGANLINRHDQGRLVQQSYYGDGQYPDCGWGLNPVQGGDKYGNPSGIAEWNNDGQTIYVRTQPLDWCKRNTRTNTMMENWYTLEGKAVHVLSRFTTGDVGLGAIRDQELPAIFGLAEDNHFVRYAGSAPYTGGLPTSDIPGFPNEFQVQSEGWGAHLDARGNGLGWYTPHLYYSTNYNYKGAGGSGDYGDATSYTAPLYDFAIAPNSVYQFEYYLIPGTVADVRQVALAHRVETASSWGFPYADDREGWSQSAANARKVAEASGAWTFSPAPGRPTRIVSPPVTFSSSHNQLRIRLRNGIDAPSLTLAWKRSGYPERSADAYSSAATFPLKPSANGFTDYTFDLSKLSNWSGLIEGLQLTVTGRKPGSFAIDSMEWVAGSEGQAPRILEQTVKPVTASLTDVTFRTDIPATAAVDYGPNFVYGFHTPDDIGLRTDHIVHLSGLVGGQIYHYRIRTRNGDGRETIGPDRTFRAPLTPSSTINSSWTVNLHPKPVQAGAANGAAGPLPESAQAWFLNALPITALLLLGAGLIRRRRASR